MFKKLRKLVCLLVILTMILNLFIPQISFASESSENLALGKAVTASSFDSAGYEGTKITDGVINDSHEWYSWGRTNEWVCVDLGSTKSFDHVKVYWGTGYAAGYRIQGSDNGTAFTNIPGATITNGTGGTVTINFTAVSYRYVRLYTTTAATGNYGHEIMELEVYGSGSVSVPSAPTGLTATASTTSASITLNWTAVSGATGYYVYRNGGATAIGNTASASYTDSDLSYNTTYSYTVAAYNSAGTSSQSSSAAATTPAQQTGTNIVFGKSFTSSTTCTGASYVTDGDASTSSNYADLAGTNLQWIQFDLGEGTVTSSIKLWHYYSDGRTYKDVIVRLSNSSTFASGVTTVFNNDSDNSAGMGIGTDAAYAESQTGKTINVNNVTARYIRFYTNGSSANAYNHYVEVQVYGTAGTITVPSAPSGLTATASTTSASITLNWTGVSGATGYYIYRNGGTTAIGSTASTSYTDSGLANSTTYSYTVAAYNSAGTSSKSSPASATTIAGGTSAAKVNGIWTSESQLSNTTANLQNWFSQCLSKNITRIYARAGYINLNGTYDQQTNTAISNKYMAQFLKVAKTNSAYNNLKIFAYVNAGDSPCNASVSEAQFNTFKTAFVNYCIQMINTGVPISDTEYYKFDGLQIDIEHCDESNMSLTRLKTILDEIRAGVGNNVYISVCSTGETDQYEWTAAHIQLIAQTADEIAPMAYDSAWMSSPAHDAASYKAYVTTKLTHYDNALAGQTHCTLGFGVPSYGGSDGHVLAWETMANSLDAINAYIASKGGIANTKISGCNIFWMNAFLGTAHEAPSGYGTYRTADQAAWTSKWASE